MLKIVFMCMTGFVLIVLTGALGCLFTWMGWNYGVVPAVGFAHEISFLQAFFFSVFFSSIGAMFKSSLTINSVS